MSKQRPSVLIVDDSPIVQKSLRRVLLQNGYTVSTASNGQEALDVTAGAVPDLFLLDIMMPEMDGYELCRRLKALPEAEGAPVIFITALDQKDDIIAGFDAGAVDYIPKPFRDEEVVARVGAHVKLHRALAENEEYARHMEELAAERARALVHAERLAAIGLLAAGIAHEINNPTSVIRGNAQILQKVWPDVEQALQSLPAPSRGVTMALEEGEGLLSDTAGAADRIRKIVAYLKQFSRKEQGDQREPCDINRCVEVALGLSRNALKYHMEVIAEMAEALPPVNAHEQQIEQVLINLFTNAADSVGTNASGTLWVRTQTDGNGVVLTVEDDGPGIPDDALPHLFDAFFTTKDADHGSGLGLSISRGIVQDHGGTIEAANRPDGGACFTIRLPGPPASTPAD